MFSKQPSEEAGEGTVMMIEDANVFEIGSGEPAALTCALSLVVSFFAASVLVGTVESRLLKRLCFV